MVRFKFLHLPQAGIHLMKYIKSAISMKMPWAVDTEKKQCCVRGRVRNHLMCFSRIRFGYLDRGMVTSY